MARRENRKPAEAEAIVVAILRASGRPLTAYDIQDRAVEGGQRLYPSQVYRTMDRLIAAGTVRRIETGRTYMLGDASIDAVAVCDQCGQVTAHALGATAEAVSAVLGAGGFTVRSLVIEGLGRCDLCTG